MKRLAPTCVASGFFVLAAIIEGPLAHRFAIWEATPSLLLVCVFCTALFVGRAWGAVLGFAVGLVHTALAGAAGAAFLLNGTIFGFAAGWAPRFVSPQHWAVGPSVVLVCSMLAKGLFLLLNPQPDLGNWVQLAVVGSAYNAVLSLPMYLLLVRAVKAAQEH